MQLTHISLVSFLLDIDKQCGPRSDAAKNVASHQDLHNAFQQRYEKVGKQFHFLYVVGDWLLYWSYTFLYVQRIPTTLIQTRKTVSFFVCG